MGSTGMSARWWGYWAAAWGMVAVVWMSDVAFQFIRAGAASELHMGLWYSLLTIAPGALLSLLAWTAINRAELASRPLAPKLGAYVLLGASYWFAWSLSTTVLAWMGLFFGADGAGDFRTTLFQQLAGNGFNGSLLFAALVTAYEARHHAGNARHAEVHAAGLRAELARAQMAALNTQLSPHFLFNTLHVASGLMRSDASAARTVLADLAGLLRGSLEVRGRGLIPLEEELRLTERYLDIQKVRFRDRLTIEIDLEPRTLGFGVPPFLLQPLVENAIVHGVSRSTAPGWVRLSSTFEGDELCLIVEDSGAGASGDDPCSPQERIGLGGTRRRLALHFGDGASLELSRRAGEGTRVEVRLPVRPSGDPPQPETSISCPTGPTDSLGAGRPRDPALHGTIAR